MRLNKWDLTVDQSYRLTIPKDLPPEIRNYFNSTVILMEGDDGCIQIHKPAMARRIRQFEPMFKVEVKKEFRKNRRSPRGYKTRRIQVPLGLRRALSFLYGRTVTLAENGESLKLWPRPSHN